MSVQAEVYEICKSARSASRAMMRLTTADKNRVIEAMAVALDERREDIKKANALDLAEAQAAGVKDSLIDRLMLDDKRIDAMIQGVREVAALSDPSGEVVKEYHTPSGLFIRKVRCPIGVIGIIYESRPNVTADAAVLCFKAGNAVILKGGKEAKHSNLVIAEALIAGGVKAGMPEGAVQLISITDRDAVRALVQMTDFVDLVIPRGGESLIRAVTEQAHVPVIKHYKGVCHLYVDRAAVDSVALDIAENAKCQRPGVCNAIETLLVHSEIAARFLPALYSRLLAQGVQFRLDEESMKHFPEGSREKAQLATEADWYEEYLDLIIAVRVVPSVDVAIEHINFYGSHHSDSIISTDEDAVAKFLLEVDSASVYANTSTRFTDGGEFGLGAEIGISTDKLHARGPMGVEELTTSKYVIISDGLVRK
ncbi:MAG: glutamate-5-semialdehyde dehydrogenase [bacterium]|nr:glutamate-5-semialdehyde dehydrogenase [bacterium]